eukprot:scaffold218321_cov28-Tisochrysis_lutea.AAC.3
MSAVVAARAAARLRSADASHSDGGPVLIVCVPPLHRARANAHLAVPAATLSASSREMARRRSKSFLAEESSGVPRCHRPAMPVV